MMVTFPTDTGDLSPIEIVWAQLRKDLAKLEQKDFTSKPRRLSTELQFRARVVSLLKSYEQPKPGQQYGFLRKLVSGMPKRLQKCRSNNFGPCGK